MKSQAIVAYGQPLEEVTSDIPTPKGTEVVVKISHSGVCHSDVHLQDGHVDLSAMATRLIGPRAARFPTRWATRSKARSQP
jgi:D-arabinose 1-dehydrogenase-like Zn-dependent alcohol dehydrogenase